MSIQFTKYLGCIMLEFTGFNNTEIVASKLVQGDEFFKAVYAEYIPVLKSITKYRVEKTLKREVVCKSESGRELRVSVNGNISHCYQVGSPKLKELRDEILLANRRSAAAKIISAYPLSESADAELLAAIEAYGERMKALAEGK